MAKKQKEDLIIAGEEKKQEPQQLPQPAAPIMSYEAWWLLTQRRLNLQPGIREALRKHMRSRGFLDNGRFDDGLRDFGIES